MRSYKEEYLEKMMGWSKEELEEYDREQREYYERCIPELTEEERQQKLDFQEYDRHYWDNIQARL